MDDAVVVSVDDLLFLTKIRETAGRLGVKIEVVELEKLRARVQETPPRAIIVDLNHRSGAAVETVSSIKTDPRSSRIPILGFLSHIQTDLAASARQAGCDQVLARSTFSQQLPGLLSKLAAKD